MTPEETNEIVLDIETTGLHPWYGDRVTCICASNSNGLVFKCRLLEEDDDCEAELINKFICWCYSRINKRPFRFVTFNGKEFDIPFLLTRYTITNNGIGNKLVTDLADNSDIDLHEELRKLTGKRISLDTAAKLMGCNTKSGKGEDAIKLWDECRFDELKSYCMQDVEVTWQVYQKWKALNEKATGQDTSTDEP